MRRPRRAAVGVLSPRRAPKLGKIHRCACIRLIPFPGTGDVLLVPKMISHPLAYVAPTTRHRLLRPDVGAQEPDAIVDDDYYYSGGAYYYVQPADGDRE